MPIRLGSGGAQATEEESPSPQGAQCVRPMGQCGRVSTELLANIDQEEALADEQSQSRQQQCWAGLWDSRVDATDKESLNPDPDPETGAQGN